MARCLICNSGIEPFMSFGKMPIANGFLKAEQFVDEYFFELKVGCCPKCAMVQLTELVDREKMFHENYAFYSSTSMRMIHHFREFAESVRTHYLAGPDPFVIEIGSNDGIMLQNFAQSGIRHLGIEPSANVAQVAIDKGVRTISRFFDEQLAAQIVEENGPADAFIGGNVMCHIPYLHSVVAGIKKILKPRGVLVFEDPYLGDIVEKTSYDQIYDEHAFYFSVAALGQLFEPYDMEIVDAVPQNVHGGSMRYVVARRGAYEVKESVGRQRNKEAALGLQERRTYENLRKNIERSRDELLKLLRTLKHDHKRVVGYGATSKSTTVTNFCGITPDLVEFISDTTPIKQGKFSPGAHIPVKPYSAFTNPYPDYALLFAWNHGEEIVAKEDKFRESGGRFIVYVPRVKAL